MLGLTEEQRSRLSIREAFTGTLRMRSLQEETVPLPAGMIGFIEIDAGKADIVNENKRLYSKLVYALAVERCQELVSGAQFLGEVDHPWMGTLQGAAVKYTKVHMDGDMMKGEGFILDTPGGRILKSLLDGGVGVKVSTRGYGSQEVTEMEVNGEKCEVAVVQEDYFMEGIDFVLFPSNKFGAVTRHEHANQRQESRHMNVEQLRKEFPELVAVIEAAAREGYVAQADHDTAVAEARAAGKAEALESEEVKGLRSAVTAAAEAVKAFLPVVEQAAEQVEKTEAEKQVEAFQATIAQLTEQVGALTQEKQAAQQAADQAAARTKVQEKVDELLKDYAFADVLREGLLACETPEAVQAAFDERSAFITRVQAVAGVTATQTTEGEATASGTGEAEVEAPVLEEVQETEEEERTREARYAGVPA